MSDIINVAIIAHVDHGKTTMTDAILKQCGSFRDAEGAGELIMDNQDQEKERGITITAKNCAVQLPSGKKLNVIDTPGHSDFGSEVERVLGMADAALLVVDAFEGPMPQTRFVLRHAISRGLPILVVFNKIDKPNIDPDMAMDKIFDLFVELGATDTQCDFPYVYAIGRDGRAGTECNVEALASDLTPLFELIEDKVPVREVSEGNGRMQITSLMGDSYLGRIVVGRVDRGTISVGDNLQFENAEGEKKTGKVQKLFSWNGVSRVEVQEAGANDVIAIAGVGEATIGDTVCVGDYDSLERGAIEEPTLEVMFYPNSSPFAGREGDFVTSRQIAERLERELLTNVGLRVIPNDEGFRVAGRGELHIGVLLETMRREGYEVAVGKPQVLLNDAGQEPYEDVYIDVPEDMAGSIIEALGKRNGDMLSMESAEGRTLLTYKIPTRGLLGFRSLFMVLTGGEGILTSAFSDFGPAAGEIESLRNGAMISGEAGKVLAYSLDNLQKRAVLFVEPGDDVYEGQVIGECNRDEVLTVNPTKGKQLTNVRASGTDDSIVLTPARKMTLEQSLEWIADDELLEVTPENLRLRKKLLTENERKRSR